jgi:hypothetical protein
MKRVALVCLAAFGLLAVGCKENVKSTRTFRLPEGNAVNGQAAFVSLQCIRCHSVAGIDLPPPTAPALKTLALGGKVARMRTYGDLLTSIIHPEFALSDARSPEQQAKLFTSPMRSFNQVMTVQQLIDLVTFLQPSYTQLEPLYVMQENGIP